MLYVFDLNFNDDITDSTKLNTSEIIFMCAMYVCLYIF